MIPGRSHNNDLIGRAFIQKILNEESQNMETAQNRVLAGAGKDQRIDMVRYSRSFSVSETSLKHTHNIQQRFIDMKRTRFGKKKPVPVHNSILFTHFNTVVYRLATNLTETLRAQIAQQLNIELYG